MWPRGGPAPASASAGPARSRTAGSARTPGPAVLLGVPALLARGVGVVVVEVLGGARGLAAQGPDLAPGQQDDGINRDGQQGGHNDVDPPHLWSPARMRMSWAFRFCATRRPSV